MPQKSKSLKKTLFFQCFCSNLSVSLETSSKNAVDDDGARYDNDDDNDDDDDDGDDDDDDGNVDLGDDGGKNEDDDNGEDDKWQGLYRSTPPTLIPGVPGAFCHMGPFRGRMVGPRPAASWLPHDRI